MSPRSFFATLYLSFLFCASSTAAPLNYSSFIQWDYPHLPKLTGWRETERMINTALSEGYPQLQSGQRVRNGSAEDWTSFAKARGLKSDLQVIYLAAHQSPAGQWVLTDGTVLQADQLLPILMNSKGMVVFLDSCNSCSADPGKAGRVIFASAAKEPTPDLFPYRRSPIDWRRFCPHSLAWLHLHHFGGSDERLSFFGLVWLEAFLTAPHPPADLADWMAVGDKMETISQAVLNEVDHRDASTISLGSGGTSTK